LRTILAESVVALCTFQEELPEVGAMLAFMAVRAIAPNLSGRLVWTIGHIVNLNVDCKGWMLVIVEQTVNEVGRHGDAKLGGPALRTGSLVISVPASLGQGALEEGIGVSETK
jgi:hypothetical protein